MSAKPARFAAIAALAALAAFSAGAAFAQDSAQQPPAAPAPPAQPAPSAQPPAAAVAKAQAGLAMALMTRLAAQGAGAQEGALVVSPASLAAILAVVAEGAEPLMRAAVAKTLDAALAPGGAEPSLAALLDARKALAADRSGQLQTADRLVFAPGYGPPAALLARFDALGVERAEMDLAKPAEAARIDAWVNEKTEGAIPELLGGPVENSAFVALDALRFKGKWLAPFDPKSTAPAPFTGADGKSGETRMMRLAMGERAFRLDETFVGADLPFVGERFSLVVVTTREGPAQLDAFAPAADWLTGAGFSLRRGEIALPRFKLSARADLLGVLDALGLEPARSSPGAFSGYGREARLSQILQRAMIEVNEEGAEAAAATAVVMMRSLRLDDNVHMIVDRPFVFALRDKETGMILVAGYVGRAPKG